MAILTAKKSSDAVEEAIKEIEDRKKGLIQGIKTPWPKLNATLGGFQQGWSYLIAGSSGVGKSTILTLIERGLFEYNQEPILLLCFCLEVSSTMTIIKKLSADLEVEIDRLMSFNEPLTDAQLEKIKIASNKYNLHKILYFEDSLTVDDLEETVTYYSLAAKEKGLKVLVALDHTLLIDKNKEKDGHEVMANLAKMSIRSKKKLNCTYLFLGQLNGNQEKLERLQNPSFHAPIKDDLYGAKYLWMALDCALIPIRPDLLGLEYYTAAQLSCTDRMYMHIIKNRFGKLGYITFDTSKIGVNKLIEL